MLTKFPLICYFVSLVFCLYFLTPVEVFALDIERERPVPMWGLPSAEWREPATGVDRKSYSNPEATIVIRNTAPATLPEMRFFTDCAINSEATLFNCFYFIPGSSSRLLNSKTYANNGMKSAVAVLRYPPKNIIGDTYALSYLGDFAYWGRHLREIANSSGSNAFWQAEDYQFNLSAQAYWDSGNSAKNSVMKATIARISADAKTSSSMTGASSYVHIFNGVCGTTNVCSEADMYPEGRVWKYYYNSFGGEIHYYNRGTIIVESNNFHIYSPSVLNTNNEPEANLGVIVRNGSVTIENVTGNSMKINASFFVPNGTISVIGDNITLTGSFVAQNFSVSGANINFVQDTRGEDSWPPGFRELQLPNVFSK